MGESNNEEKSDVTTNSAATYMTEKQTILLHTEIVKYLFYSVAPQGIGFEW